MIHDLLTLNKHWAPWLVLLTTYAAFVVGKRIHATVGVLLFVLLISAIAHGVSTDTSLCIVLFAFFFAHLDRKREWLIMEWLYGLCLISSVVTLFQLGGAPWTRMGVSGNSSMNGCLIALTLPIALHRLGKGVAPKAMQGVMLALALVAIFATQASIPVGVLALITFYSATWWLAPMSLSVIALGYFLDPAFLSSSGRFQGWSMITKWWWESGHILTGWGTGAGAVIFNEQRQANPAFKHMAIWAHNDFLQVLFDNGVAGLLAMLAVMLAAMIHSYARPWLFKSIIAYAATMFFNFPLHVPIHASVGACLLWLAFRGKRE
jgi:hypothetical protein